MNEKAGMFSYKDVKIKDKKDNELNSWNIWFPIFGVGTKTRFLGPFKVNVRALIYVLNDSSFFFFYLVNTEGQTSQLSQYRQLLSVVCDSAMFWVVCRWYLDGSMANTITNHIHYSYSQFKTNRQSNQYCVVKIPKAYVEYSSLISSRYRYGFTDSTRT